MMNIAKIIDGLEEEEQSITKFDLPNGSVPCNNDEVLSYIEWLRKIQKEIPYPTKIVYKCGLCALVPLRKDGEN